MDRATSLPSFGPNARVVELDGKACPTLRSFYSAIAKAMDFPDHFGKNLDALFDCLSDLSWIEAPEIALVVRNGKAFLAKASTASRKAVFEIFEEAESGQTDASKQLRVVILEG